MEETKVSAESNDPLGCNNSAQVTKRAVDQAHKSKSHSRTKDKNGPKSNSPHVEKTRPENSLAQSAGKDYLKKKKTASLINIQRLKKPELSSDNEARSHNCRPRKRRREKFHSERPRPGSDSPKSSDSVSGSSGSDQEQTCSSDYNLDNGSDHYDSGLSG